jgi:hypothetical protein
MAWEESKLLCLAFFVLKTPFLPYRFLGAPYHPILSLRPSTSSVHPIPAHNLNGKFPAAGGAAEMLGIKQAMLASRIQALGLSRQPGEG